MSKLVFVSGYPTQGLKAQAEARGIVFSESFSVEDLLDYGNNRKNIEDKYVDNIGQPARQDVIEPGTRIEYPSDRISKKFALARDHAIGKVYEGTDFTAFFEYGMNNIVRDERYKPIFNEYIDGAKRNGDPNAASTYVKVKNDYNILLWSRSFGGANEEGRLMNITPFVSSINCEETEAGGNFSINISNPPFTWSESNGYTIDPEKIYIINNGGKISFYSKENVRNIEHASNAEYPPALFQLVPSSNDIVFIQFEPLQLEYEDGSLRRRLELPDDGQLTIDSLWVDPSEIKGATWDMMGLIDQVSGMSAPAESGVITNISGRDFNKLVVEDSNYFFAADTALGRNGFLGQRNALNGINAMRNVTGAAEFLEAFTSRSVAYSLGFIFNQMVNITVLDGDGPFSSYDTAVDERGVIRKIKEEFVSEERLQELIKTLSITEEQARSGSISRVANAEVAPGIWKSIRLVIDPELADRHLIDSSISTAQGSVRSFIDKVCQPEFAQFYGQTWGDKFYFIARKPPTTLKAFMSYEAAGLVVDVETHEVAEYEFGFAESDAQNWYYVEHRNTIMSSGVSGDNLAFLPSGFIEAQAKRYGVKVSHVVSNYVGINFWGGDSSPSQLESFRKQTSEDMKFILESNAGLPYTRKGTFICLANRRIRSGMFINFKPTGEVGYVTSTSNVANDRNGDTNRATIVNVERMMVRSHLDKYFEIATLEERVRTSDKGPIYEYGVKEHNDNIKFFEKKLQFIK